MTKSNINNLPEELESKKISKKDAINAIWAEIYIKPYVYGLEDLDEDEKSEFLLDVREKLGLLFTKYNKELGTFSTFIRGCLIFMKSSWKKRIRKEKSKRSTTETFLINNFQNDSENFLPENFLDKSFFESDGKIKKLKKSSDCKTKIKIFTILALTLKACRDVDDDLISKISNFIGMDEKALQNLVQEMKNITIQNEDAREKLIEKRNKAFYSRRNCRIEMKKNAIDHFTYEKLKARFNKHTKSWIKSNECLSKRGISGPTIVDVAKKLGLKPRTVGFYLFCAKKNLSKEQIEETVDNESSETTCDKN